VSPTDNSVELRVPPYDFAYSFLAGGAPPHTEIGGRDGNLGLDARSGQDAADRFVNAHHGVGCIVRIDRLTSIQLFATRSSRWSYVAAARGINAWATSDGGLETTFNRGGTVLDAGTLPLFHRRVSGPDEEQRDRTNWTNGIYPDGMGDRIDPGEYAFNVGIWAITDFSFGIGGAALVQSIVQSSILDMRIHRRG
jgi:hypothetical protein